MKRVAFIGLGAMGLPMANNLAQGGVELAVFNRSLAKADGFAARGVSIASSPREAASRAAIVCTCVADPDALRQVLLGPDGALAGAEAGTLFVDFSTVDPGTSRGIGQACRDAGCSFLEAPVSGGVKGAEAGTLTIIAGGDPVDFERARPVLDIVGKQITHVGPIGAGSTIKLINQMLVGVNLAAVLDAFLLGSLAGIDPQTLYDQLSQSSGNSATLQRAVPNNLLPRQFQPGFTVDLLTKDLRLALELARSLDMELPTASAVIARFEEASRVGLGGQDTSAALLPMERRHGVEVGTGGAKDGGIG